MYQTTVLLTKIYICIYIAICNILFGGAKHAGIIKYIIQKKGQKETTITNYQKEKEKIKINDKRTKRKKKVIREKSHLKN